MNQVKYWEKNKGHQQSLLLLLLNLLLQKGRNEEILPTSRYTRHTNAFVFDSTKIYIDA